MATFTMNIKCDGAAFHDDEGKFDPSFELTQIIGKARNLVKVGFIMGYCHDTNGNPVGTWEINE
jgi:hypothetical protein